MPNLSRPLTWSDVAYAFDDGINIVGLAGPDGSIYPLGRSYLSWEDAIVDLTPTIYFDSTASTSTNAGTLANPYNSLTTLASVMTGSKGGTVLGIKRGTVTRLTSTLLFDGLYGLYYAPVVIVPYGTGDPPVLNGAAVLTGWTDTGVGGVYSKDVTSQIASMPEPAVWEDQTRLWKAASLAALQGGATGYYFYDSGTKTLYVKPSGNPNTSVSIEMALVEIVLDISYGNVADTGYITVSGIDVRGACSNSALRIAPKAIGSITTASNITVCGVKVGMSGRDAANGTNDGLLINGPSDTVRLSGLVVRGVYGWDCLNNAVEINGASGAIVEYVESHDCCGKNVEFFASVSTSIVRYCRGYDHTEANIVTFSVNSAAFWVAAYALTSGVGAGTSGADATKSLTNTFHHNLYDNIKTNGLLLDAGSGHKVHHNTFASSTATAASYNRFNNGLTGVEFSNNLTILRAAVPAMWVRTGVTNFTGDGNCYVFQAATTNKFYTDNTTAQTTLATWASAMSADANARIVALPTVSSDIADDVLPQIRSTGVTGLGYSRDQIGDAMDYPPVAGCFA